MTAPLSLREYFAAAGSAFTKADAEVIGPQIEAMAEDGEVSERAVVDTAKSTNSPLHRFFEWNDTIASDNWRLHQAGTMLRAIRVRTIEDGRPRVTPAYKVARQATRSPLPRAHNVLHGDSAAAVAKAKTALDELAGWRARYQPFVTVWRDFAQAFQSVSNQIGEAQDVVNTAALDDRTDDALTDMQAIMTACAAWRARHSGTGEAWAALDEQAGFMIEAIDEAARVFGERGARERACLRCGRPFLSRDAGNRLCDRCAEKISTSGL